MIKKAIITLAKSSKMYGSSLSCRLVKATGKYHQPVHPHHLVQAEELWFLKHLKPEDVVLDIGCHNGQHSIKAARRVKKVTGFDYDQRFLDHAEAAAKKEGITNLSVAFGNAEETYPFADNTFDAVLFLDVLEHLNKRQEALKEVFRVIRPDGRLFVSIPKRDTTWKESQKKVGLFYYSDPDHKIEYSRDEIEDELARAGFSMIACDPITYDTWTGGIIDVIGGLHLGAYRKAQEWRRKKALERPEETIGFYIIAKPNKTESPKSKKK